MSNRKKAESYQASLGEITPISMFGEGVLAGDHADETDIHYGDNNCGTVIYCCSSASGATNKEKY